MAVPGIRVTETKKPADMPAEHFDYDNPDWYRELLLHLRYTVNSLAYDHMADIFAEYLRNRTGFGAPGTPDPDGVAADVERLRRQGWCKVGRVLNDDQIREIHDFLRDRPVTPDPVVGTDWFAPGDAPDDMNVGHVGVSDLLHAPYLARIANASGVLARVAEFLKAPPTIQFYTGWWSYGGRPAPKDAQLYHVDRHCYRFLKLFIYLTDVTEDTGPHCYVAGSADLAGWAQKLKQLEETDPAAAKRGWAMIRAIRKDDAEVEWFFGRDRVQTLTGRAGEAFLVNTQGIHKGIMPRTNDRLVFQTLYTLLPTIRQAADLTPRPGFYAEVGRQNAVPDAYLRYVNRLAVVDA